MRGENVQWKCLEICPPNKAGFQPNWDTGDILFIHSFSNHSCPEHLLSSLYVLSSISIFASKSSW